MKILHEPLVVTLAGLELEWPRIGMGPMKYVEILQENANVCQKMHPKYADMSENAQIICNYLHYVKICTKNMRINVKIWTQYA